MRIIFCIGLILSCAQAYTQEMQLKDVLSKMEMFTHKIDFEHKSSSHDHTTPYFTSEIDSITLSKPLRLSLLQFPPSEAIFCRIESNIRQNSQVFFKFRLGSVDYVDRLEGKNVPNIDWKHF